MVESTEKIGFPRPYMVFDPDGYHCCSVLTAEFIHSDSDGFKIYPIMCVLCQDYSLSDYMDNTIQKLCPKGFTAEQIRSKMVLLDKKVKWGRRPMDIEARRRRRRQGKEDKLPLGDLLPILYKEWTSGLEADFIALAMKRRCLTRVEAKQLLVRLVEEGQILRDPDGFWRRVQ